MGWTALIGILIFAVIFIIWYFAFYSKNSNKKTNISNDESADVNAYKKSFIFNGKVYKFSKEDLSDEERAKEMAHVAADELLKDKEKE